MHSDTAKTDYENAIFRPSENFGERRGSRGIELLILHYTGMSTGEDAENWLCDPASEVSSHYVVHENGQVVQLVREAHRAWHAGKASWKGVEDINSVSVGIEIVNSGHEGGLPAYSRRQIEAVCDLSKEICGRHSIKPEAVLGHSDVAPGRKVDPGEHFPWDILFENGVGHFVPASQTEGGRFFQEGDAGQPVEALQSMLSLYGYKLPISGQFCAQTRIVVEAFQRHFRSKRVDGVADAATIETLYSLLKLLN
ncbi:MAG: N-acetylmuramoyl-L-alanine amidase [Pseudomonadota bacterium]